MTTPRLNVDMFNLTSRFSNDDPSSPYPPNSPSANSEVEYSSLALRASIATVSDSRIRAIIVKLAESSPQFHHAIMKELEHDQASGECSPTTPTTPKTRRPERHRSRPRRHHKSLSVSTQIPIHDHKRHTSTATEGSCQGDCVYHPGNLEQDDYEFLSGTGPDDIQLTVVRTITMWSCCAQEEWSPGCMNATMIPAQFMVEHDNRYDASLSHDDVFPDSDLEERHDLSCRSVSETKRSTK